MLKCAGLVALSVAVLLTAGCGESEQEKRFHQELVEKALYDDVRKAGDAFLAANAAKPNVITTASGLQYTILQTGQGPSPMIADAVRVNYKGWRIDGEVFDSSYEQGEPLIFPLKRVIKGWREALLGMQVGARWRIFVPSGLAYGAISPSDKVPANSVLVFDIELLEIVPGEQVE